MAEQTKPAAQAKLGPAEIKQLKELKELKRKNEELEKQNAEALEQLKTAAEKAEVPTKEALAPTTIDPNQIIISEMQSQIKMLSDQVMMSQSIQLQGKPRYKPVPPEDFQDEPVVFSARKVYYVIGSYLDHKGVEIMPPYKLIKFQYASSDIRKEGHEESIVNSCSVTTHLKGEIEFLRGHPAYAIEFFENVNQTMKSDAIYTEFRIKAANQVVGMKDESVINSCHQKGVKNVNTVGIKDLRRMLTGILAEAYIVDAKELKSDLDRKRLLGQPISE